MSFTSTTTALPIELKLRDTTAATGGGTSTTDTSNNYCDDEEQRLVEEFARRVSFASEDAVEREGARPLRRLSRASVGFFQRETSTSSLLDKSNGNAKTGGERQRNSFLGLDGTIQDDYIARRVEINKPTTTNSDGNTNTKTIPVLADLREAESITEIDGNVLSQLFLSGYAKLSTRVNYLNKINVFPIADGDTGANMKVCLKLPSRNLVLDPSSSILRVASNMAADVLLNGQGNSGTILSHFYVSLAEVIRDFATSENNSTRGNSVQNPCDVLSIDEFAICLARTGAKMSDAVPNPVEGTLLSVARDSCTGLMGEGSNNNRSHQYANLGELLTVWKELAEAELQKTPDQLIVDGVRVLEKAGVVDSGAQGFVYTVQGMWLATRGELPEASDPRLFQTAVRKPDGEEKNLSDGFIDDHSVCDSKYRFCTEAVILLKDGVTKQNVLDAIDDACQGGAEEEKSNGFASCGGCCTSAIALGDSLACVGAPSKEGGSMLLKIHIHTNEPQRFFDTLLPFSKNPVFVKEKVEDMKLMRDVEHGRNGKIKNTENESVNNAKFTVIGLSALCLPPTLLAENKNILNTFPMFLVPADTNEPIDIRYSTDTEALVALNQQRNPSTAVRYTTATSSPMQMKIELLAALSKGKPVLALVFSTNRKISAFGRNVLQAIELLNPEQKDMVKVFVHGWGNDGPFMMEAIECAGRGDTIDDAISRCEDLAERSFGRIGFMDSEMFRKMKAWRPGLFNGVEIPEGHHSISGTPPGIRRNGVALEKRTQLLLAPIGMGSSRKDAFRKAAQHIKSGLEPGQKLANVLLPCVGRPDYGHIFLQTLEEAGIEIVGMPYVYSEGMIGVVLGAWGSVNLMYKIVDE